MTLTRFSRHAIVVAALTVSAVGLASMQGPAASPEALGFSPARLGRIDTFMQEAVDGGRLSGVVALITRRGQVAHFKAYGMQDRERAIPMRTDTIFRVASMTKTPTSIAMMMLVEEGKVLLGDPVSKFIPAFKNTTVAIPAPPHAPAGTPPFTVVPAKREIRIHDLLSKTAGMGYPPAHLRSTYAPLDLHSFYFADKAVPMATTIEQIAGMPFTSHPGEKYENGFATDVAGVVIEKASGMSLDQFFRTRIFAPLKMTDTSFFLPKEKISRLATVYAAQSDGTITRGEDHSSRGQGHFVDGPGVAFSGGGGLLSTATDYDRMVQVLLNGGELDGVRLLAPKTVRLMLSNQVGNSYQNPGFGRLGFGYGFELTLDPAGAHHLGSPGDFGYRSAYFTRYMGDPVEQLSTIFLAQLSNYGGSSDLHYRFRSLVYGALVDPAKTPTSLHGAH
jgi:CubicO group peptidase (beta-lactamase class C family)